MSLKRLTLAAGLLTLLTLALSLMVPPTPLEGQIRGDRTADIDVRCVSGCSGGTLDDDDGSIAGAQEVGISAALNYLWSGAAWVRASVSNGAVDTGTQRVTIANDSTGIVGTELPAPAALADATANPTVPAVAAYLMAFNGTTWDRVTKTTDPCDGGTKTFVPIDIVTATTVELGDPVASQFYYICGINLVTNAANSVAIASDNTDGCGSITAGLNGGVTAAEGWTFGANGGIALGNGSGTVMKTGTVQHSLCILTSAATQLSGTISYVSAP